MSIDNFIIGAALEAFGRCRGNLTVMEFLADYDEGPIGIACDDFLSTNPRAEYPSCRVRFTERVLGVLYP